MSKMYKPVLLFLFVALGATLTSCSGTPDKKSVAHAAVTVQTVLPQLQSESGISASGQIEAEDIAKIGTRMMGYVKEVPVKIGDRVKKGTLLIRIADDELNAKNAQTQAMIHEAEAAYNSARRDLERFTALYKKGSVSAKELENITLHYESMSAKVEMARQMSSEVMANQSYTRITAPFDGIVTQVNIQQGALANPGIPLVVMEKKGVKIINSSVSESAIRLLTEGMKVHVTVQSAQLAFESTLVEKSISSLASGGQFQIKIAVPAAMTEEVYSGMYVNLFIPTSAHTQHEKLNLLIPAKALVEKEGLKGVYVVSKDQKALLRWVRVGKMWGESIEILSGLDGGEKVILQSESRLYNGVPVR